MNKIVERFRVYYMERKLPTWGEIREAADEIERLEREIRSHMHNANLLYEEIRELRKCGERLPACRAG